MLCELTLDNIFSFVGEGYYYSLANVSKQWYNSYKNRYPRCHTHCKNLTAAMVRAAPWAPTLREFSISNWDIDLEVLKALAHILPYFEPICLYRTALAKGDCRILDWLKSNVLFDNLGTTIYSIPLTSIQWLCLNNIVPNLLENIRSTALIDRGRWDIIDWLETQSFTYKHPGHVRARSKREVEFCIKHKFKMGILSIYDSMGQLAIDILVAMRHVRVYPPDFDPQYIRMISLAGLVMMNISDQYMDVYAAASGSLDFLKVQTRLGRRKVRAADLTEIASIYEQGGVVEWLDSLSKEEAAGDTYVIDGDVIGIDFEAEADNGEICPDWLIECFVNWYSTTSSHSFRITTYPQLVSLGIGGEFIELCTAAARQRPA